MFQNVRFVSESGCKGKDFFITSKLFKRNFWSFFFKPRPGQYSEELCATQNSGNQPFTTTHLRYWFNPSFPDCGCKDRTIYTPSPNFLSTFFRKNRLHTLNKLITKGFTLQNYYTQTYVISKIGSNPCFKKGKEKRKIKNRAGIDKSFLPNKTRITSNDFQ